jgi:hypothetical protein
MEVQLEFLDRTGWNLEHDLYARSGKTIVTEVWKSSCNSRVSEIGAKPINDRLHVHHFRVNPFPAAKVPNCLKYPSKTSQNVIRNSAPHLRDISSMVSRNPMFGCDPILNRNAMIHNIIAWAFSKVRSGRSIKSFSTDQKSATLCWAPISHCIALHCNRIRIFQIAPAGRRVSTFHFFNQHTEKLYRHRRSIFPSIPITWKRSCAKAVISPRSPRLSHSRFLWFLELNCWLMTRNCSAVHFQFVTQSSFDFISGRSRTWRKRNRAILLIQGQTITAFCPHFGLNKKIIKQLLKQFPREKLCKRKLWTKSRSSAYIGRRVSSNKTMYSFLSEQGVLEWMMRLPSDFPLREREILNTIGVRPLIISIDTSSSHSIVIVATTYRRSPLTSLKGQWDHFLADCAPVLRHSY